MYGNNSVSNYNFNGSVLKSPYSQSQLSLEQSNWEQPFNIRDVGAPDDYPGNFYPSNQEVPKTFVKSNNVSNSVSKQRPQSAASKLGGGYSMPAFGKYVPPVVKNSNVVSNNSIFSNRRYQRRQVILIQKHIRGHLVRKRVSKLKNSAALTLINPSQLTRDDESIVTINNSAQQREKMKIEIARIEIAKYMQLEKAKLLAEKREIENYLKIQRKNYEDELILVRDASEKALRRVQEVARKQIVASSASSYKSAFPPDVTYDTMNLTAASMRDESRLATSQVIHNHSKHDVAKDPLGPIPGLAGKFVFKPMKVPVHANTLPASGITNIFLNEVKKAEKVRNNNHKDMLQYMRKISNNLTRRKNQRRNLKLTYYNKFASVIQAAIRGYLQRKKRPKIFMVVEKALKIKEKELLEREKQLGYTYADIFKQAKDEAQLRHETEVLKMLKKLKNIEKKLIEEENVSPESMVKELDLGVTTGAAAGKYNLKEYLSVSDSTKKWLRDITTDAVTFLLSEDHTSNIVRPTNNILSDPIGGATGIQLHIESICNSNRIKDIRYISAMEMPMREYAMCFLGIWDVLVMWKAVTELLRLNFFELLLQHYTKPVQERLQNEDVFIHFIKFGRSHYVKRCNKLKIMIYNIAVTFGLELDSANVITGELSNILEKRFDLYDVEKLKTVGFECANYHEKMIRSWDHYYNILLQHRCDADYFIGCGAAFLDICLDLSKEITACGYDVKQTTSILLQTIDQEKLIGLVNGIESIMFIDDEVLDTYKLEQSEVIYNIVTLEETELLPSDALSEVDMNIKKSELALAVIPSPPSSVLDAQPKVRSDPTPPPEIPAVISYSITEQIKLSKLFKLFLGIWETMLASSIQKIILSANFQNYISDLIMSLTKQREKERGVLQEEICKLAKHTSTTLTSTYSSHLRHHESAKSDAPRKIYETSRNVTECIHDLNRLLNSGRMILHRYDKFYLFKKECQLINPSNDDDDIINGSLVCIDEAIGNVLVTLGGFLSSISIRLMQPTADSSTKAIHNIDIDTCWNIIGSKLIAGFTTFANSFGISVDQTQIDQITVECRKILVLSLSTLKEFDWNEFWNKRDDYKRLIKDEQYLFAVVTEAERLMFSPLNEHDQYEIDISSDLFKIIQQAVSY